MPNEGLKGIRLTDIYGYDQKGYETFYNNNINEIESTSKAKNMSSDAVGGNMYINSLIKNKMGDDWYAKNAKGKTFSQKLEAYNSLFGNDVMESQMSSDTTSVSNEINNIVTNDNSVDNQIVAGDYFNGNLAPFKFESGNETYRDWFGRNANTKIEDRQNDTQPNIDRTLRIFDTIYDRNLPPMKGDEVKSSAAIKRVAELAPEIRSKIDADPRLANDMYIEFENNALNKLNDFKNYQNTPMLPLTPNEMKDIMSEYYSKGIIQGDEVANDWLYETIHNKVWKNQNIFQKAKNAFLGAGGYAVGQVVGLAGAAANIIPAAIATTKGWNNIDDVSWWSNFTSKIVDNPLTKWGNGLAETGSWYSKEQEERRKTGYNAYQIMRRAGTENDFLNWNTIWDMVQQSGFTIGASASASVVTGLMRNTIGKAANKVATRVISQALPKTVDRLYKGIDLAGKTLGVGSTSYMLGLVEASMDGMSVYDHYMGDPLNYLLNLQKIDENGNTISPVDEYIKNEAGPGGGFQRYYEEHRDKSIRFNPESQTQFDETQYNERMQREYNMLYDEYRKDVAQRMLDTPQIRRELENTALRNSARVLNDEALYIGFGDMLMTNILGGAFKAAKNDVRRAMFGGLRESDLIKLGRKAGGSIEAKAADYGLLQKAKSVGKAGWESFWEGGEEMFQNNDVMVHQTLGDNYMAQYILNSGDPDALNGLSDKVRENWDATSAIIGQNLLSGESVYSFLLGAASAAVGNPTMVRGSVNFANRRASGATNKNNILADWVNDIAKHPSDYWRNPFAEAINEDRARHLHAAQEADDINAWLSNHEDLAKMNDMAQFTSWMIKASEASIQESSDVDYRDALMGQRIAGILMMDRIGAKLGGRGFKSQLKALSEITMNDPNANQVINAAMQTQNVKGEITEKKRERILNDVREKARNAYEMYDKIHDARERINSMFGESISENTKDAWAFQSIMQDDYARRISDIENNARESYNKSGAKYNASTTASDVENAYARYGGVESARQILSEFEAKKAELKGKKSTMPGFRYRAKKRRLNKSIETIKDAIKTLGGVTETPLITADKILGLDTESRAVLLDEKNLSKYSEAQRKEINKFKNTNGITNEILVALNDANILKQRMEAFEDDLKDMTKNVSNMVFYDNSIRREAANKLLKTRLDRALRANMFEAFEDEMNKFMDQPRSVYEDLELDNVLKDNKFYGDWVKLNQKRETDGFVLNRSSVYNNMQRAEKRAFDLAYDRALRDKDTSFDHMLDILNDESFRDMLADRYGVSKDVTIDADVINGVLDQINNYNENVKAIKQVEDNLKSAASQSSQKTERKTIGEIRMGTTLNRQTYEVDRDNYMSLFRRMVDFIMGKSKKVNNLNLKDLIDIANLYVDPAYKITDTLIEDQSFDDGKFIDSVNSMLKTARQLFDKAMTEDKFTDEQFNKLRGTKALIELYSRLIGNYGDSKTLGEFMRRDIFEMEKTTDFGKMFAKALPKADKFTRLNRLTSKGISEYSPAERKWFEDNHIGENFIEAKSQYDLAGGRTGRMIFIIDDSLVQAVGEDYTVDSDNKPVIMAVAVKNGTKNSFTYNGQAYLKIGLMSNSRSVATEDKNQMNSMRESSEVDKNGIVSITDSNGNTTAYMSYGITFPNAEVVGNIEQSAINYLSGKYGLNTEEEIKEALKKGDVIRFAKIKYDQDKDDKSVIHRTYVGIDGNIYMLDDKMLKSQEEIDSWEKDRLGSWTNDAIIDKDGNVMFLNVKDYEDYSFITGEKDDARQVGVVDLLTNTDLIEDKNESSLRSALRAIADKIIPRTNPYADKSNPYISDLVEKIERVFAGRLSETDFNNFIQKAFNDATDTINKRYVNFSKSKKDNKSKVQFKARIDKTNRAINIFWTDRDENVTPNKYGMQSISIDDLYAAYRYVIDNSNGKQKDNNRINNDYVSSLSDSRRKEAYDKVKSQIQSMFASAVLNNNFDGIRKNNRGFNIAKPQVDYENLSNYSYNRDSDEMMHNVNVDNVINNDAIKVISVERPNMSIETNTGSGTYGENKAKANSEKSKTDVTDAIERINQFILTDDTVRHQGEGVTTFISKYKADDSMYLDQTAGNVAKSLGTTLDKIFRLFIDFRSKEGRKGSVEDYERQLNEWLFENTKPNADSHGWGSFPGVGKKGLNTIMESFKKNVIDVIEARGETILPKEFYFTADINGKKISMIPDMITVDKNGKYHIYDYKTIRYRNGVSSKFTNRSGMVFTIDGFSNPNTVSKWGDQLSMYKEIIESATGLRGSVASIEIIPITLNYSTEGVTSKNYDTKDVTFSNIGDNVTPFVGKDGKYINVSEDAVISNNFISFQPKNVDDINKLAWMTDTDGKSIGEIDGEIETPRVENKPVSKQTIVEDVVQDDKKLDDVQCEGGASGAKSTVSAGSDIIDDLF